MNAAVTSRVPRGVRTDFVFEDNLPAHVLYKGNVKTLAK